MKLLFALLGFILISAYAQDSVREATNTAVAVLSGSDLNPFIECNDDPNVSRIDQVLSEPTPRAAGRCPAAVAPGQFRLMHRRNSGYRSGNFLFKNLGNNRYRAVMNIKFQSSTPGLAESMRARTMNCMREMAPYLLGPGKELDIQILNADETRRLPRNQRPDEYVINVTRERKDYRGNANNYGSNFQCVTIGHEILHFLGLCDEYYEGIKDESSGGTAGRYIDWRCRAVTSEPSYMRNMIYAFQSTVPQTSRCECDEKCQAIMRHSPEARRLYLGMNGEDYLNTEMSLMGRNIISLNASGRPVYQQICRFVDTPSLPRGVLPQKPFELHSESGNRFVFRSYEAYWAQDIQGQPGQIWYGVQTYDCTCPEGEQNNFCRRLMEQMKQRTREYHPRVTCPQGTRPLANAPSIGHQNVSDPLQCENGNCTLVMTSRGSNRPLLLPQQFERIASGDCRGGAAAAYESCEDFATVGRNRPNFNFSMKVPEDTSENLCSQLPPQCNDDRYFLHGQSSATAAQ